MEDKNLTERLKNIEESLSTLSQETPKKPKIIRKIKTSAMKKANNWITVITIQENNEMKVHKEQIKGQSIVVDNVPRLATGEHILHYKKEPTMILPSWSVKPFAPSTNFNESLKDGSNTTGYRILLERMQSGVLAAKKKMGIGISIGILIILGVVVYGVLA